MFYVLGLDCPSMVQPPCNNTQPLRSEDVRGATAVDVFRA